MTLWVVVVWKLLYILADGRGHPVLIKLFDVAILKTVISYAELMCVWSQEIAILRMLLSWKMKRRFGNCDFQMVS
jgi:hypothetical protein